MREGGGELEMHWQWYEESGLMNLFMSTAEKRHIG